jgi:transposase
VRLKLSLQERLAFHQLRSGFLMEGLRDWMNAQMEKKKVEPNSALGEAFGYYLKHWTALTLFVREPGTPLDNNGCLCSGIRNPQDPDKSSKKGTNHRTAA